MNFDNRNAILFQITQDELIALVGNIGNTDALGSSGIRLGGKKYM